MPNVALRQRPNGVRRYPDTAAAGWVTPDPNMRLPNADGAPSMTFHEIIALLHRHILAVAVVVLLASLAGYDILTTPPVYSESGSVIFTMTRHPAGLTRSSNQSVLIGQSLIATEATMAEAVSSPPAAA